VRDKAQLKAAAAAHYRRLLLRRSLQQWLWLLDGQQLLTRVFAAADAAWDAREQQQQLVAGGDAGDRGAPFARDFQLLRKAFNTWRHFAAAQLMSTAALAAHEAAAAYHTSRLKVRAWSAWCRAVQEVRAWACGWHRRWQTGWLARQSTAMHGWSRVCR
jgi:hypothetical protein